jgi:hypothetical protein
MTVLFPSCWDGLNLDSADHQSHLSYSQSGTSCPGSHPVPVPQLEFSFSYPVTVLNGGTAGNSTGWSLTSDSYVVDNQNPGGYSAHATWINAWHPEVLNTWVSQCIQSGALCNASNLGNGFGLGAGDAGTGNIPSP